MSTPLQPLYGQQVGGGNPQSQMLANLLQGVQQAKPTNGSALGLDLLAAGLAQNKANQLQNTNPGSYTDGFMGASPSTVADLLSGLGVNAAGPGGGTPGAGAAGAAFNWGS